MKKLLTLLTVIFTLSATAQKQDSLILNIQMDTTTFKNVVQLIQENIPANTATGKVLLQSILQPFYSNLKLVVREAEKPKAIQPPVKK